MEHRLAMTAYFGVSEVVIRRAECFLAFEIGWRRDGAAVTMRELFVHAGDDPMAMATRLMTIDPLMAVKVVTTMIAAFVIDDERAPDPQSVARRALTHAGRVVTWEEAHPERAFVRRVLNTLLSWAFPAGPPSSGDGGAPKARAARHGGFTKREDQVETDEAVAGWHSALGDDRHVDLGGGGVERRRASRS